MEHYCPHRFSRQFGFHQDIPADIDFSILPSSRAMLRLHQACVRYGTNSQVFSPGQCLSLERKFTQRFQEWWSDVFSASSGTQSGGNSKRKRDSSTDQNIRREEGAFGSRPKLRIIRSQNPSRPLILASEDDLPQDKIPGIGVALSATPIPAIPIQSVAMTAKAPNEVRLTPEFSPAAAYRQKLKSIIVCTPNEQAMFSIQGNGLTSEKIILPPPDGAENIMDILDCDPSPTECMVIIFFF